MAGTNLSGAFQFEHKTSLGAIFARVVRKLTNEADLRKWVDRR